MSIVKVIVNSSRGKLIGCPRTVERKIYKKCSYFIEGSEFSEKFQNGIWDGYARKYSLKTSSFPSGILLRVLDILKREGLSVEIEDKRKKFIWDEEVVSENLKEFKYILRDYQLDGLIRGLKVPYMVFWWATGAGKTVEFAALITALKKDQYRHTLILVASKDLAFQHREKLGEALGTKIGLVQEGIFKPERVTVAVINTIWIKGVKQKNKEILKYLDSIEHLICDETHRVIESKMFKQTISKCKNTIARHGFSGTPFSLSVDDIELESVTGPPLSKVPLTYLINEGWAAIPIVTMVKYDHAVISNRKSFQSAYKEGIVEYMPRNKIIRDISFKEYTEDSNSIALITVRQIKHGKIIKDLLLEKGVYPADIDFISGSSPMFVRNEVKEKMINGEVRIVIVTVIWNEGIDIPAINTLILADGGGAGNVTKKKGIRPLIQKVGRGIRKPILPGETDVRRDIDSFVKVYDFFDEGHKHLRRQSVNRYLTFKMEKAFRIQESRYEPEED